MPERLECEVLQKARYINTLTFTFTFLHNILFALYAAIFKFWYDSGQLQEHLHDDGDGSTPNSQITWKLKFGKGKIG